MKADMQAYASAVITKNPQCETLGTQRVIRELLIDSF